MKSLGHSMRCNNPWVGKVQWQIRRFLCSLYQKPLYLSICPTILFGKVKNRCGRFAPHTGVQMRRKSGVSNVLRSKISAQGRFIRSEQAQSPKGERPKGTNPAMPPSGGRAKWHVNSERSAELSIGGISFRRENDKIGTEVCIAHRSPNPPEIRRLKRFATQNLGAGGI